MKKLKRKDLFSLEKYSEIRDDFRLKVINHKKNRRLQIGPNTALYFEDYLIMHYQIQEMLRAEKIFESGAISEELSVYNELIPDGSNWKATFMIEFSDPEERAIRLEELVGIEDTIWLATNDHKKIYKII